MSTAIHRAIRRSSFGKKSSLGSPRSDAAATSEGKDPCDVSRSSHQSSVEGGSRVSKASSATSGTLGSGGSRGKGIQSRIKASVSKMGARKKALDRLNQLVEKRQWDRLRDLLDGVERACRIGDAPAMIPEELWEKDDAGGRTLLHSLCAKAAPADLVEALAALAPFCVLRRDDDRRTPLHLAVIVADASLVNIVERLLAVDPRCVAKRDGHGRTPLVLACQELGRRVPMKEPAPKSGRGSGHMRRFGSAHRRTDAEVSEKVGEKDEARIRRLSDAIEMMAHACPECVPIEDASEKNALEYAIFNEAPKRVLAALKTPKCAVAEHR